MTEIQIDPLPRIAISDKIMRKLDIRRKTLRCLEVVFIAPVRMMRDGPAFAIRWWAAWLVITLVWGFTVPVIMLGVLVILALLGLYPDWVLYQY